MLRATVLVILLFVASSAGIDVNACYGNRPLPITVDFPGCTKMPCDVVIGTTAIMQVEFAGNRDNIEKISAKLRVTALGITVPYELPEEIADVCSNLLNGASCPIDEGEDVTYNFQFPIEDYYPEMNAKLELSLVDDSTDQYLACFVTGIKVKKSS